MVWVAIEDAEDTHEMSEFEQTTETQVLCLMDAYMVDTCNPTRFRLQDVEGDAHIVYEGATYKGGFGYDIWVARKYREM